MPYPTNSGVTIVQGDITEQDVDAVVNAANSSQQGRQGGDERGAPGAARQRAGAGVRTSP